MIMIYSALLSTSSMRLIRPLDSTSSTLLLTLLYRELLFLDVNSMSDISSRE